MVGDGRLVGDRWVVVGGGSEGAGWCWGELDQVGWCLFFRV